MNPSTTGIRRLIIVCGIVAIASAQQTSQQTSSPPPESKPANRDPAVGSPPPPSSQPTAEEIQQQMQEMLSDNPQFNPSQSQPPTHQPGQATIPQQPSTVTTETTSPSYAPNFDLDVDVLGIPPGGKQPQLRREGEFVINRRGRLSRSPSGTRLLFVFEADSDAAPEPPMPILPCQILENMEDLSNQRNNQVVFILSGQVTLYRGVNFLLPTMMKLAIDRGNIRN